MLHAMPGGSNEKYRLSCPHGLACFPWDSVRIAITSNPMKLPWIAAAVVFSATSPVFALTAADVAPSALKGKTLSFTVVNGNAPFATTGTWSGTFSPTGTSFAVKKITGDTVNITSTLTGVSQDGEYTNYTAAEFIQGRGPATIMLYVDSAGTGRYEIYINDLMGAGTNGTFTIGPVIPPVVTSLGITNDGKTLKDGKSATKFGTVALGKKKSETYVIKNTGNSPLKKINVAVSGKDSGSFKILKPGKTTLPVGAKTSFTVTFAPKTKGTKTAALKITSSDSSGPFDIKLGGNAKK